MADAKIRVTAEDKTKGVLGRIKKSIGGFGLASIGAAVSLGSLAIATKKVIDAANEQEKAEVKLTAALKAAGEFTVENFEALKDMASAQQQVTTFGDEATIAALAQLKAYSQLSTEMMIRLTPAVQNFASAQGVDLKTAMELVGKSIGSSTNALSRYGIEIDTSASKVEKAEQLMKALNERFGGQAAAQAETFGGRITQLSNAFGDFTEEIGFALTQSGFLGDAIGKLTDMFTKLNVKLGESRQEDIKLRKEGLEALKNELKELEKGAIKTNLIIGKDHVQAVQYANAEDERRVAIVEGHIKRLEEELKVIEKVDKKKKDKSKESADAAAIAAEEEINRLADWEQKKTEILKRQEEERAAVRKWVAKQKKTMAEEEAENVKKANRIIADSERKKQDALRSTVSDMANNLAIIADEIKEFTILAKAAAIAQATIAGTEAAVHSFKFGTIVGGPIVGGIMAGISAAATSILIGKIAAAPSFQTPETATRIVPGSSQDAVPIIAHGGEQVGRGAGGVTINFNGTSFNADETASAIMGMLRDHQFRTGEVIV